MPFFHTFFNFFLKLFSNFYQKFSQKLFFASPPESLHFSYFLFLCISPSSFHTARPFSSTSLCPPFFALSFFSRGRSCPLAWFSRCCLSAPARGGEKSPPMPPPPPPPPLSPPPLSPPQSLAEEMDEADRRDDAFALLACLLALTLIIGLILALIILTLVGGA